mmetsp:Transcript_56201/g.92959  ORF Transcript_56201/g.92959 Transcript_56201/m.92959 type:complete len:103 (-) Transcript_56201:254-562(-)
MHDCRISNRSVSIQKLGCNQAIDGLQVRTIMLNESSFGSCYEVARCGLNQAWNRWRLSASPHGLRPAVGKSYTVARRQCADTSGSNCYARTIPKATPTRILT